MNDAISDILNRIYTNSLVGNKRVSFPATKMTESIVTVLHSEGFIDSFEKNGKSNKKSIEVEIAYISQDESGKEKGKLRPVFEGFNRISKPSRRVYAGVKDIMYDRADRTTRFLSTPKGVLSEKDARKNGVGGEVLFEIW